jgi:hypothetical protein
MDVDKVIKYNDIPPEVKTKKSDDYREITQDRLFAGIREGYFIYVIQNEVFNTNQTDDTIEGECFTDEVQVKVSPQQMVKMHALFGNLIANYQKIYGEIKSLEQIIAEKPDLFRDTTNNPEKN